MLKKILYVLAILFLVGIVAFLFLDEPLPEGKEGPRAELLADKMLAAIGHEQYKSIGAISWSYPRGHDYIWDKKNHLAKVTWEDFEVLLNLKTETGIVFKNKEEIKNKEAIQTALNYFYNDSFWLIAPNKVRDPGTIRKLVNHEGKEALLVQYTSGGVTPGDSYLWILDNSSLPKAWKFWVQIVPVGGIEFTWENWQEHNGAQISTLHKGLLDIEITNLKTASTPAALNNGEDPFKRLQ